MSDFEKVSILKTRLLRHSSESLDLRKGSVVTVGNFDGVHRGHASLLELLDKRKEELRDRVAQSIVVSFYPNPALVLGKTTEQPIISPLRQKLELMSAFNVDYLYLIHFTKSFSALTASDFIDSILLAKLRAKHLVLGPDARVGYQRQGTPEFIAEHLRKERKKVDILPALEVNETKISSRLIRSLIESGDIRQANQLLGRCFAFQSRVIKGEQLGRKLGFPTLNMRSGQQVVPADGVYATLTSLDGKLRPSATSIGTRPTVNGQERLIETHLIDYKGPDLYRQCLEVSFVEKLREQVKYDNIEELTDQIKKDVEYTREALKAFF